MEAAKIGDGPHASPKGLRHGFGVNAVSRGIPLNMVQNGKVDGSRPVIHDSNLCRRRGGRGKKHRRQDVVRQTMNLLSNDAFLRWAAPHGTGLDPRYPELLAFVPKRGQPVLGHALRFARNACLGVLLLDALDPWRNCWIYKRAGSWSFSRMQARTPRTVRKTS